MADTEAAEVQEAIETIAEAAGENAALENAVEAAQARTDEAEAAAARIAAAAMESERGQFLEQLREDFEQWQEETNAALQSLRTEVTSLSAQLSEALMKLATPPQVTVTVPTPDQVPSSIPPTSEEPAPVATVTVNPAESGDGLPAPAPAAKPRQRWL